MENWSKYGKSQLLQAKKDYDQNDLNQDPYFRGQRPALIKEINKRKKEGSIRKDAGIKRTRKTGFQGFGGFGF